MSSAKFIKRIENFICEKCGIEVKGNGFTNHCPNCLWSKHVDIHPGDRGEICQGLMEPIGAEVKRDDYLIHFKCLRCGFKHKVRAAKDDDFEIILKLVHKPLEK